MTKIQMQKENAITIPRGLFSQRISTQEGERFLTRSEIITCAYIKKTINGKFSIRGLSRRLNLSVGSVARAIKNLTAAGLIKRKT